MVAMPAFDLLMRPRQVHEGGRQAVIPNERMPAHGVFDLPFGLRLAAVKNLTAIVHAAFDKDRHRCRGAYPVTLTRDAIQPGAVSAGRGQESDVLEIRLGEAQASHHQEKKLGVRLAERQPARVLFIDVLGKHASHGKRGIPGVYPREQHREVADVSGKFLLEVDFELCRADIRAAESGPRPVILPVHDRQQPLAELRRSQGTRPPPPGGPLLRAIVERCRILVGTDPGQVAKWLHIVSAPYPYPYPWNNEARFVPVDS